MGPFQQALDHSLKTYFINGLYLESIYKVLFPGASSLILRYPSVAGPWGLRMSGGPNPAHPEGLKRERFLEEPEIAADPTQKPTLFKDSA
jgi:hypothetical protein